MVAISDFYYDFSGRSNYNPGPKLGLKPVYIFAVLERQIIYFVNPILRYKKELLLLLITLFFSLAAAELALRLFVKDIVPLYVPDAELGYVYWKNFETERYNGEAGKKIKIETNSYGFVDKQWQPDPQAFKIMVVGDSFVEALQVDGENRFTNLLEKKFLESGRKAQVFNLGRGGVGPESYLKFLRKFYPILKPDAVIVSLYNGNDFLNVNSKTAPDLRRVNYLARGDEVIAYSQIADAREKLSWRIKAVMGKFYLTQFAYKSYLHLKQRRPPDNAAESEPVSAGQTAPFYCQVNNPNLADSFKISKKLFQEMKAIAGDRLVILQVPDKEQFEGQSNEECDYTLPEKHVSQAAREDGIKLIQLFELAQREYKNYYDSHLTPEGHQFVSDILFYYLNSVK